MPEVAEDLGFAQWVERAELQDLIDQRYALEQQRKAAAAEERNVKRMIAQIDDELLQYHENNPEVSQVQGETATVSWSEELVFSIEGDCKDQVRQYLIDNQAEYLMTWHLNNAATREYVALHGELPNVNPFVKKKVSCRKR